MKPLKANQTTGRDASLLALRLAILEGATARYEPLVQAALAAGATDEDIDSIAHDTMQVLFDSAEQPVTPRTLSHVWHNGHYRQ